MFTKLRPAVSPRRVDRQSVGDKRQRERAGEAALALAEAVESRRGARDGIKPTATLVGVCAFS